MVTSFIGALMMIRCGTLPAPSEGNERNIKTVLATGAYRAQCIMLHHCANLLLKNLPPHRQDLLMDNSVLLTGTTTPHQSSTTRHTVLLTPTALHRWTDSSVKPPKMVNAVSRQENTLCLIQPCTRHRKDATHNARKLYNILYTTVFRESIPYTLTTLATEILDCGYSDAYATQWATSLFNEWRALHRRLNYDLNDQTIPPSMPPFIRIETLQGSHADNATASTICMSPASSAPAVMANAQVGTCLLYTSPSPRDA